MEYINAVVDGQAFFGQGFYIDHCYQEKGVVQVERLKRSLCCHNLLVSKAAILQTMDRKNQLKSKVREAVFNGFRTKAATGGSLTVPVRIRLQMLQQNPD